MCAKKVSSSTISKVTLKKKLGFPVKNLAGYSAALTHPSYRNENPAEKLEDFDRLEFLGDAILNETICQKLFSAFPEANEGMLSRLRSTLVSRKILSRIAGDLKLEKILRIGKSLRQSLKGGLKAKVLTDALEALFAAIYFDRGQGQVQKFILKLFKDYFDPKLLFRLDPNPKSALQELTLRHWQKLPQYKHHYSSQGVKTTVSIDRKRKATACSRMRRDSEIKAAFQLIRMIRKELKERKSLAGI